MNKKEYEVQVSLGILTPSERVRLAQCKDCETDEETLIMLTRYDPQPSVRRIAAESLLRCYGKICKSETQSA